MKPVNTFSNDNVTFKHRDCASGAKVAIARFDDLTAEQYVNADGTFMSTDVAVHNVKSVKQKTMVFKNGDIFGKTFRCRELTINLVNGDPIVINLFMDNSTDES